MAFVELVPVRLVAQAKGLAVKLGTRTRSGYTYGLLSMGAIIRGGRDRVDIAVDERSRQIRISFVSTGAFKIAALHKGGGMVLLPPANWLPPRCFKALPIEVVSRTASVVVVQWPESWPEPPQAEQ